MRLLQRFLAVVFLCAVAIAVVLFVLENQQTLELSSFGLVWPVLPVSVYFLFAFVFGGIAGVFSAYIVIFRLRMRIKACEAQLSGKT